MSRTRILLVAVIVAELCVGGLLAVRRLDKASPPLPDFSEVDSVTASEFRRLAANCQTADDWATLGETYLATGFFPEAEACLRHASKLDTKSTEFAFKHAFALERIGRLDEANAQYRSAIDRNHPRVADCWYYIGRNHLRMEQPDLALLAFGRADGLPAAKYELALLAARDGRTARADEVAAQLASEFPNAYPPASLRYRLALTRNDRPATELLSDQFFRRRVPLPTPFDTEVQWVFGTADGFGRAKLFRDAGREAEAGRFVGSEEKLRSALAARWEPEVADRLADVVFTLRRPDEAVRSLTEVVERGGPSFERLWRLGQAYVALDQADKALAVWERAARFASGPRARDLWHDLASWYENAKQPDKAKPLYARAYLIDGTDALTAGRPDDAVRALKQAVEADPQLAHAWFALGEAHRFASRTDDARTAYNQCLKINPDHGRAIRSLKLLGG
ncbi:MAG: tetratricopeptide repeat protein [Planctomycetia bacterium]|nr:tetratricopeptide repeat protein [Planctomycetia bacterium]